MLGRLCRWLRALGYDASFAHGIEDRLLVERARAEGRVLLSSDEPLCRAVGAAGLPDRDRSEAPARLRPLPQALFIPGALSRDAKLLRVVRTFSLPVLPPRCMPCGGSLREVPRGEAEAEAPPRALELTRRFWRCAGCGKLFWEGTHWQEIQKRLQEAAAPAGPPRPGEPSPP